MFSSTQTIKVTKPLPYTWKNIEDLSGKWQCHEFLQRFEVPRITASFWHVANRLIYTNLSMGMHGQIILMMEYLCWVHTGARVSVEEKDGAVSPNVKMRGSAAANKVGGEWWRKDHDELYLWSMAASVMIWPLDSHWPMTTSADEA